MRRNTAVTTAALVLLVVAVVVAVRLDAAARALNPPAPAVAGQAESATQAVVGYLTAVAEAKADDALTYLAEPPSSTLFMTDEVLGASAKINPITDIRILSASGQGDKKSVEVRYRFGGERVEGYYHVSESSDGHWRLDTASTKFRGGGFVTIPFSGGGVMASGVPVRLNGVVVPVETEILELLPGTYVLEVDHPMLANPDPMVVLTSRISLAPREWSRLPSGNAVEKAVLTEDGKQKVYDFARSALDACLKEMGFQTSCGPAIGTLRFYNLPVVDSTARWSLVPGTPDIAEAILVEQWVLPLSAPVYSERSTALWVEAFFPYVDGLSEPDGPVVRGEVALISDAPLREWQTLRKYYVNILDPDSLEINFYWSSYRRISEDPS
ncbi:MAG: hypothetical protein FWD18_07380 [Micrococcales bacterium]|nr:hypothetical protein [Micrococcales bacterium]